MHAVPREEPAEVEELPAPPASPQASANCGRVVTVYDGIFIYPLLTAALFHLFARATITKALWSRFPTWLTGVTQCPSCSGFWYGILVTAIGIYIFDKPFLGRIDWWVIVDAGLCSLVWTPIVAALHEFTIRAVTNSRFPIMVEVVEATKATDVTDGD